jgi:hypothetical protein
MQHTTKYEASAKSAERRKYVLESHIDRNACAKPHVRTDSAPAASSEESPIYPHSAVGSLEIRKVLQSVRACMKCRVMLWVTILLLRNDIKFTLFSGKPMRHEFARRGDDVEFSAR